MSVHPYDSDAIHAAVTAAALRVAAYCEKHGIAITPAQCEDLAVTLVNHYQAFLAGVHYAAARQHGTEPDPAGKPDAGVGPGGQ